MVGALQFVPHMSMPLAAEAALQRPPLELSPDDRSPDVAALIAVVHRHMFDPGLSVKTLKARCRVRDNNVSSRFKIETGTYLHAYIAARRLDAASNILRETDIPIGLVALRVGYRHLQTFYRAFKHRYGCTPAALRRPSGGRRAPPRHAR